MAELGLMRGVANLIYSFRVSRVQIPPLPPIEILNKKQTQIKHKNNWLMLIPYEGSIGDNTYKLRAVGGRASMII